MAWELCRISNGHLSLENSELESDKIFEILSSIEQKLGEKPEFGGKLGITPSAAAVELRVNGARITVGWDNWSGIFIMAWDSEGDRIIENEIADIFIKNS